MALEPLIFSIWKMIAQRLATVMAATGIAPARFTARCCLLQAHFIVYFKTKPAYKR